MAKTWTVWDSTFPLIARYFCISNASEAFFTTCITFSRNAPHCNSLPSPTANKCAYRELHARTISHVKQLTKANSYSHRLLHWESTLMPTRVEGSSKWISNSTIRIESLNFKSWYLLYHVQRLNIFTELYLFQQDCKKKYMKSGIVDLFLDLNRPNSILNVMLFNLASVFNFMTMLLFISTPVPTMLISNWILPCFPSLSHPTRAQQWYRTTWSSVTRSPRCWCAWCPPGAARWARCASAWCWSWPCSSWYHSVCTKTSPGLRRRASWVWRASWLSCLPSCTNCWPAIMLSCEYNFICPGVGLFVFLVALKCYHSWWHPAWRR